MASSTSSSDPFPSRERWWRIWICAGVVALCFAAYVTSSRFSWFYDPTSADKRIEAVRQQAIAARPNASILILGSSRAAFGLVPSVIERNLDRPPLSVANWSYPAFSLHNYEALVATDREKIAAAEIVVLGIDPYFALTAEPPVTPADQYQFTRQNWAATLDRAIRARVSEIVPVAGKMAWFIHELGGRLRWVTPYRLNWTMRPDGAWQNRGIDSVLGQRDAQRESRILAQIYFKGKRVSDVEVLSWRRFLRALTAINPHVLLIYLPMAPSFRPAERAYARVIGENRRVFEALAEEAAVKIIELTDAECGLSDGMFADPTHVNGAGMERLSACFTMRLRPELSGRG